MDALRPPTWPYDPAFLVFVVPATLISSAFVLAFTMPFIGALVRFRANYTPRRVQLLDQEDAESESPTADVRSYFAMLKRVHRVEGWAGLYKGIMPSIIESLVSVVLVSPFLAVVFYQPPILRYAFPLVTLTFVALSVFLLVPMEIIKNRVITTPYKLRAFEPSVALRILLSHTEREQPLRLYLLPGVALAAVLPAITTVLISTVWRIITAELILHHRNHWDWALRETVYRLLGIAFLAFTTAIITPMHVIRVRLTMQRLRRVEQASADEEPAPQLQVYSSEDVVELRTEREPYTGVQDCGKSILREEGKAAFFRGWWVTAIGLAPMFLFSEGVQLGLWFAK